MEDQNLIDLSLHYSSDDEEGNFRQDLPDVFSPDFSPGHDGGEFLSGDIIMSKSSYEKNKCFDQAEEVKFSCDCIAEEKKDSNHHSVCSSSSKSVSII